LLVKKEVEGTQSAPVPHGRGAAAKTQLTYSRRAATVAGDGSPASGKLSG